MDLSHIQIRGYDFQGHILEQLGAALLKPGIAPAGISIHYLGLELREKTPPGKDPGHPPAEIIPFLHQPVGCVLIHPQDRRRAAGFHPHYGGLSQRKAMH